MQATHHKNRTFVLSLNEQLLFTTKKIFLDYAADPDLQDKFHHAFVDDLLFRANSKDPNVAQ